MSNENKTFGDFLESDNGRFYARDVNGRFYARDVNVVSDIKAVSRRLKRLA